MTSSLDRRAPEGRDARTWRARLAPSFGIWAVAVLALPAFASAQDRWTEPRPGIRRLHRSASGPREIHALVIDLCHAGVSLRATRSGERGQTVPSWASGRSVEAAVNGDFFSFGSYSPSGAAMGNGEAWGPADHRGEGFIGLGRDRVLLSPANDVVDPLPGWARDVVSGKPTILRAGEVVDHSGYDLCTARHPRTALGLSEDRQTLFLMVVDGRSSASIGMTCAEEARFLRELGADDAVNLDGGGSSTMWLRGAGVVNRPSDGSARVVANHLGVHADGSGIPASCMPWAPEEDELIAGVHGSTTTDVNGDGRADVCIRRAAGVRCALADGVGLGAVIDGPELADASGWADPTNHRTLVMGDVNGDGLADLCARADAGLRCWPSTGDGFGPSFGMDEMTDAGGWDRPEHYATLALADVDGDGLDDVCARGWSGVLCWRSLGDAFAAATDPIAGTGNADGFDDPARWSTIRFADVTGDGLADACARTGEGLRCWASTGDGFAGAPIVGPSWSDASGWAAHEHYATVRLVDLDGDGRADACGRAAAGLRCHLSTGDGFGDAILLDALRDAAGWDALSRYATLTFADVDGDGDRDVCARHADGVQCWPFEGGSFGARIDGPTLSNASGWGRAYYWRTIRFADLDGDGDDDVCARAAAGVRCWRAEAGGFAAEAIAGPAWSNESGFWAERFAPTLRFASRPITPAPPVPPVPPPAADDAGPPHGVDAATPTGGDGGVPIGPSDPPGGGIEGGCSAVAGGTRGGLAPTLFAIAMVLVAIGRRGR